MVKPKGRIHNWQTEKVFFYKSINYFNLSIFQSTRPSKLNFVLTYFSWEELAIHFHHRYYRWILKCGCLMNPVFWSWSRIVNQNIWQILIYSELMVLRITSLAGYTAYIQHTDGRSMLLKIIGKKSKEYKVVVILFSHLYHAQTFEKYMIF